MSLKTELKKRLAVIDKELEVFLPIYSDPQGVIFESMRYSMFAGGKRLRPILMLAACEFVGGNKALAMPYACALEMIHTYSLIHDDLPAMDDDDYRRGKLTNHKVYGDGLAILAGDGLLNLAYETMLNTVKDFTGFSERKIKAMLEISQASGVHGMIGGQVVDLLSENKKIDGDTLYFIHYHKTASLIIASVRAGAIIGGASDEELEALTRYAKNIGLGFQITDDILDLIGDEKKIGKKVGSDLQNQKSTFPSIYGLEYSKSKVMELLDDSIEALQPFGNRATFLMELAEYLVKRDY